MAPGLRITVVDPDIEYLGVSVEASNGRFAGSIRRIYLGFGDLDALADRLSGFPKSVGDHRVFEIGFRTASYAGGLLRIVARTDGHSHVLELDLVDDDQHASTARFVLPVEAAGIDRFVAGLRAAESQKSGTAELPAAS